MAAPLHNPPRAGGGTRKPGIYTLLKILSRQYNLDTELMAGSETTTSQRSALRFPGNNRLLNYKTDYEDGEAQLINISTSGCAIGKPSTELQIDQKILVTLILDVPEQELQIQAKVIRAQENNFGLQFLQLEESTKRRLVRFFAKEIRRQKSDLASAS